jgi:hypothetical protein
MPETNGVTSEGRKRTRGQVKRSKQKARKAAASGTESESGTATDSDVEPAEAFAVKQVRPYHVQPYTPPMLGTAGKCGALDCR